MSNNTTSRKSSLTHSHHNYDYNHPSSFSSSLLEQIYRSFDDQNSNKILHQNCDSSLSYSRRENKYDRQEKLRIHNNNNNYSYDLDQWIQKSENYKINFRRNSMVDVNNAVENFNSFSSSSTSSSDSSSGIGGFSSSESESVHISSKSKTKNLMLKPIRTSFNNSPENQRKSYSDEIPVKKKSSNGSNKESNLHKRALKLYSDLKKVRQPISPGGKLASFLNSLFNSTASKKAKISTSSSSLTNGDKFSTSMPSTASSYARSCLSKTPSSAGRFERRSVRFCSVNTVIDAADNKCNNVVRKVSVNDNNEELKVKILEKHRRVEEVAKQLLKNYHGRKYQNDVVNMMSKSINTNDNGKLRRRKVEDEDEDNEEDDDVSCCSSDLFELENLLDVGVNHRRYREELPVYETTHVHTNRAIANGLIL